MRFKTLEAAQNHANAQGWKGISVFRYPRMKSVFVGWSHRPDCWKHEGCQILWSN